MANLEYVSRKGDSFRVRYGVITIDVRVIEQDGNRRLGQLDNIHFPRGLYSKLVALVLCEFEKNSVGKSNHESTV
jgi:hypothetical protein